MDRSRSRSAEVNRAAAIFSAIGDPIRLTILMCLASEELRVKDLCDLFGGSQANVSGHRSPKTAS
jgi:DNA-binding transcriptional ArsR family regulator